MASTEKHAVIRKKQQLEVGRRYRGSATLNEYGEFDFRAYQKQDESANAMMKVFEEGGENFRFAFYQSNENCKMSIVVPRGDAREVERRLRDTFTRSLFRMKQYDI